MGEGGGVGWVWGGGGGGGDEGHTEIREIPVNKPYTNWLVRAIRKIITLDSV